MLKKKKIKLISLFASAFVALAGFAIGFNQIAMKAFAQSNSVFEMEDGASLKISEDGGLRFRCAGSQYKNTEDDNNERFNSFLFLHSLISSTDSFFRFVLLITSATPAAVISTVMMGINAFFICTFLLSLQVLIFQCINRIILLDLAHGIHHRNKHHQEHTQHSNANGCPRQMKLCFITFHNGKINEVSDTAGYR